MANSAAFNPSGRPLTDLRSAITRLGQQLIQSAAVGYAVQQMKYAGPLRPIAKPLSELWRECISVASVSQAVAARTTVSPDEAFLTGLLHGIGRLYIMVRSMGHVEKFGNDETFLDLVSDWHAPIGKAVLENWGFAEEMCDAVGDQNDYERRWARGAELTDVIIVGVVLAEELKHSAPGAAGMQVHQRVQTLAAIGGGLRGHPDSSQAAPRIAARCPRRLSAILRLRGARQNAAATHPFSADLIDGTYHRRSLHAAARVGAG